MSSKSLWGDLSDLETVPTPKSILLEQATYLTEATDNLLVGIIDDQDTTAHGGEFIYELNVQVPALNNYSFTLARVLHNIDLYPVVVYSSIALEKPAQCSNEDDFKRTLSDILSSGEVKKILSSLLSQVK